MSPRVAGNLVSLFDGARDYFGPRLGPVAEHEKRNRNFFLGQNIEEFGGVLMGRAIVEGQGDTLFYRAVHDLLLIRWRQFGDHGLRRNLRVAGSWLLVWTFCRLVSNA